MIKLSVFILSDIKYLVRLQKEHTRKHKITEPWAKTLVVGKLFVYWRVESTQLLSAGVSGLDLEALTRAQIDMSSGKQGGNVGFLCYRMDQNAL